MGNLAELIFNETSLKHSNCVSRSVLPSKVASGKALIFSGFKGSKTAFYLLQRSPNHAHFPRGIFFFAWECRGGILRQPTCPHASKTCRSPHSGARQTAHKGLNPRKAATAFFRPLIQRATWTCATLIAMMGSYLERFMHFLKIDSPGGLQFSAQANERRPCGRPKRLAGEPHASLGCRGFGAQAKTMTRVLFVTTSLKHRLNA